MEVDGDVDDDGSDDLMTVFGRGNGRTVSLVVRLCVVACGCVHACVYSQRTGSPVGFWMEVCVCVCVCVLMPFASLRSLFIAKERGRPNGVRAVHQSE